MKRSVRALIIVASVIVVFFLILFIMSPEKKRLTDKVRSESGSDFIELTDGLTQYETAGPEDGEPIIFVHGVSVPMYDWDYQFEVFAEYGYRVLRYNQFGRGLSDRPRGTYDAARYVRQLKDLMDSQGWEKAHIVAHSMGAAVAVEFFSAYPDMVNRLILIAPAYHLAEDHGGIAAVRIPVVGDVVAKAVLPGILADRAEGLFENAGVPDVAGYMEQFNEQTRYFGFSRSAKSLFRNNVVDELNNTYAKVDGKRTLCIWGTDDESIPEAHIRKIESLTPGISIKVLKDTGHSSNLEVPETVNILIRSFLMEE